MQVLALKLHTTRSVYISLVKSSYKAKCDDNGQWNYIDINLAYQYLEIKKELLKKRQEVIEKISKIGQIIVFLSTVWIKPWTFF